MVYDSAREVLCLSYFDFGLHTNGFSYEAKKSKIQGREMLLSMWAEIIMVEEYQLGQRKDIPLPVFSSAPSASSLLTISP